MTRLDKSPVKREVDIQDHTCNVVFDEAGIHAVRKGDKHRAKRSLSMSWDDFMDYAAPLMDGDPMEDLDEEKYEPNAFLNYEDEG